MWNWAAWYFTLFFFFCLRSSVRHYRWLWMLVKFSWFIHINRMRFFECGAVKIKGLIRWLEYIQSHWMWLAFGQSKWQSNFKFPAFLDMMSQLYVVESLVDQNLPSPLVAKTITPPGVQLWWQSCSSCVCYIFVTLRLIFCPYCWILDSFSGVLFALLRLAI